jgi:Acetyltransferase (GNAT) domain
MSFSVERFSVQQNSDETSTAEQWDDFVQHSSNGTMFHLRQFLNYHPPERFTDHSLWFKRKGAVQALMPAVEWMIDKDKTLFSHRGASYGGLVYKDVSLEAATGWIQELKSYARAHGFSKIIMTPPPMLYATAPTNYIDFALMQAGFRYQKRELTAIVNLEGASDIFQLFKPEARTATRKAQKMGVRIEQSSDFAQYYDILSHNLMLRHGVTPTHTLAELEYLASAFPNDIVLHAAYLEERMIAGVVNFIGNPRTILAFYISDNKEFQEYRALNLLFYEIFRWCKQRGAQWYDFGTFTLNMEPNFGLGRFKETFGAHGVFRDTIEVWL